MYVTPPSGVCYRGRDWTSEKATKLQLQHAFVHICRKQYKQSNTNFKQEMCFGF